MSFCESIKFDDRITKKRIACGEQNGRVQLKKGWLMQGGNFSITAKNEPVGIQQVEMATDFANHCRTTQKKSWWTMGINDREPFAYQTGQNPCENQHSAEG
jgi:hypothetical protein